MSSSSLQSRVQELNNRFTHIITLIWYFLLCYLSILRNKQIETHNQTILLKQILELKVIFHIHIW
jgi:hypothetical protein